jgi:hypothetical protein
MRWRLTRVRNCPVQIWLLAPQPAAGTETRVLGRRRIDNIPIGSVLSATWREAMRFIDRPSGVFMPRPIEHVYPEYCGLLADGEVMCGPAGPGPHTGAPMWADHNA